MIRRYIVVLSLILFVFAAITLGLQYFSNPALTTIKNRRQETERVNSLMTANLTKESVLKQIEAGNGALREIFTSQSRLSPQITTIAQANTVQITNIVFPTNSESETAGSSLAQVSFVAPNHSKVTAFFKQLETGNPLLAIDEISLTPQQDGSYQGRITVRFFTP
ncbi:MAG TPA: hypothetical protein VGE59_03795 [Patescibacteria group bacterium]